MQKLIAIPEEQYYKILAALDEALEELRQYKEKALASAANTDKGDM